MYKVIVRFADLQDENHIYEIGDNYPRKGLAPTSERIMELTSDENKIGCPLIEEIVEELIEKPKPKRKKKADVE